jgi:hypothetical protein
MGSIQESNGSHEGVKKQILLNAFDMSTVGHLSPGQWKVIVFPPRSHQAGQDISSIEAERVPEPQGQIRHEEETRILDRISEDP